MEWNSAANVIGSRQHLHMELNDGKEKMVLDSRQMEYLTIFSLVLFIRLTMIMHYIEAVQKIVL